MITVGLFGLGRMGRLHAEFLVRRVDGVRLKAVVEPDLQVARSVADALGIEASSASADSILDDKSIDAIVICSPTDTHASLIERAAAAGKHIFCEKPIAMQLPAIDRALASVEQAGVKLQIGFNRRFDANFRQIHDRVAAGVIGQPHLLRVTSRDPAPPSIDYLKVSGGLFLDMMIHDFDMARFLVAAEVEEVYALGATRIDPKIAEEANDIDTAVVTLKFADGTFGTIDNSRQAVYGYDQRVEVFGSQGMLCAENTTPHRVQLTDDIGVHGAAPHDFFMDRYPESYRLELQEFVDCVINNRELSVTGMDGRAATELALAAGRSLRECRPVRIVEIGG